MLDWSLLYIEKSSFVKFGHLNHHLKRKMVQCRSLIWKFRICERGDCPTGLLGMKFISCTVLSVESIGSCITGTVGP